MRPESDPVSCYILLYPNPLYSTFPAALPAAEAVLVAGSMTISTGQEFAVLVVVTVCCLFLSSSTTSLPILEFSCRLPSLGFSCPKELVK